MGDGFNFIACNDKVKLSIKIFTYQHIIFSVEIIGRVIKSFT